MIAATLRENLTVIAKAYARATGGSLSRTSKLFYGNASFFEDFQKGRVSVSVDKYDAILGRFRDEWPKDAEWPITQAVVIPRPTKKTG
jgi:hypothetical protein